MGDFIHIGHFAGCYFVLLASLQPVLAFNFLFQMGAAKMAPLTPLEPIHLLSDAMDHIKKVKTRVSPRFYFLIVLSCFVVFCRFCRACV